MSLVLSGLKWAKIRLDFVPVGKAEGHFSHPWMQP